MKTIIIGGFGLLIVLGVYALGVKSGRHESIRFVLPSGEEKYVESNGRTLVLLLRSEGIYCGDHLIAVSKEMEEIDGFVRKHKVGRFYILGGDDVKYGDFTRLAAQLREKYQFHVLVHTCYIPPDARLPEVPRRYWWDDFD